MMYDHNMWPPVRYHVIEIWDRLSEVEWKVDTKLYIYACGDSDEGPWAPKYITRQRRLKEIGVLCFLRNEISLSHVPCQTVIRCTGPSKCIEKTCRNLTCPPAILYSGLEIFCNASQPLDFAEARTDKIKALKEMKDYTGHPKYQDNLIIRYF